MEDREGEGVVGGWVWEHVGHNGNAGNGVECSVERESKAEQHHLTVHHCHHCQAQPWRGLAGRRRHRKTHLSA